jgi:hypothetical protein
MLQMQRRVVCAPARQAGDTAWRRRETLAPDSLLRSPATPLVVPLAAALPEPPRDVVVLRSFEWVWGAWPHVEYRMAVRPRDAPAYDAVVRYSDVAELERHHAVRVARTDGAPRLIALPSGHALPIVGKLLDSSHALRGRGLDIMLYLTSLLAAGGGVRATALDMLARCRAGVDAEPVD